MVIYRREWADERILDSCMLADDRRTPNYAVDDLRTSLHGDRTMQQGIGRHVRGFVNIPVEFGKYLCVCGEDVFHLARIYPVSPKEMRAHDVSIVYQPLDCVG